MKIDSTRLIRPLLLAAIVAAGILTSLPAFASHKSWVLKNSGSDCMFYDATASETTRGILSNTLTPARTAICPVALSARWGSTDSNLFPPPRWAAAKQAYIYAYKASDFFYCYAVGQTLSGTYYFGDTTTATPGTNGFVKIAVNTFNNWGSTLESNNTVAIRSLDYVCNVPGTSANGPTSIYGYNAKICQFDADCHELNPGDDVISVRSGDNYVQTSGFECSPLDGWDLPLFERGFDGIKNIHTSDPARVVCPIAQPSDDSWENGRQVRDTKVYYKGGSTSSTCVSNLTCPACYLTWYQQGFAYGETAVFATPPLGSGSGFVVQAGSYIGDPNLMNGEFAMNVVCTLPPGVTLNGITSLMSVTQVGTGN